MLQQTISKLSDYFDIHANHPHLGFFGEFIKMTLFNLDVTHNVKHHKQKWDLKTLKGFEYPILHEFSHLVLGFLAIHHDSFSHFLPKVDPKTDFLIPNGYQGSLESEYFAFGIDRVIQNLHTQKSFKQSFLLGIKALNHANYSELKNRDYYAWCKAEQKEIKTSIFELKRSFNFENINHKDLKIDPLSKDNITNQIGEVNKWGEPFLPLTSPTDEQINEAIYLLTPLFEHIKQLTDYGFDIKTEQGQKASQQICNIKTYDLHRLISNKNETQKYTDICQEYMSNGHNRNQVMFG